MDAGAVAVVPLECDAERSMKFCVHDGGGAGANGLISLATPSAVCTWALRSQGGDVDGHLGVVSKGHRHTDRATDVDGAWLKRRDGHGADVAGGSVGAT